MAQFQGTAGEDRDHSVSEHHTVLASLFVTFGHVIYRSKLPSPSVLAPCDYRMLQRSPFVWGYALTPRASNAKPYVLELPATTGRGREGIVIRTLITTPSCPRPLLLQLQSSIAAHRPLVAESYNFSYGLSALAACAEEAIGDDAEATEHHQPASKHRIE